MAAELLCEGLSIEKKGAVIVACLDRPNGNPMSIAMCEALTGLLSEPPEGAHVLLLTAAGESFCMGRDRAAADPASLRGEVQSLIALNEALSATRLVTVARVQGPAAGFGVGLAALCDVSVATRSARFSFPEVRIGLAPAIVLAWLERVVGRRNAFWLTATGQEVGGDSLVELGLVNEVVDDESALDAAVSSRIDALTAHSPRVHAEIRAMLRDCESLGLDQAYALSVDRLVVGSLLRGS